MQTFGASIPLGFLLFDEEGREKERGKGRLYISGGRRVNAKKSTKNAPKITLGGVSGGPWGLLGAKIEKRRMRSTFLRPLGAILAPSWGPLGAVLAFESPSWAVLGRLGALLGRLKIDVKIDQKIDENGTKSVPK